MEGRLSSGGGCCTAKYTSIYPYHGPTTQTYHKYHNIDNIMLRFRPIAPKPAVGGSVPTTPTKNDTVLKRKKQIPENTERKHTNKRGRKSSRVRSLDDHHKSFNGYKVTLPLLPEAPDLSPKYNNNKMKTNTVGHVLSMPTWLSFGSSDHSSVESTVIVEGVTGTWMDGNGLGCTDEERKVRLDDDTCPGFISDGWNRVCWTNKA
ncbi:uncharacterized protein LOC130812944 [Amaranthus tricolor]|uniref:uncharacterized protein LOC130812944 n=1 Tax=Amaranthus tricolor TaxID=29722 RepID=UPI00258BE526|nr:uncharacterized protein LOC130812944 [Amaranthus tricolor]